MSKKIIEDLQQQIDALYGTLAAANIALFKSKSIEDERVVQKLENQMNALVDKLIELESVEVKP